MSTSTSDGPERVLVVHGEQLRDSDVIDGLVSLERLQRYFVFHTVAPVDSLVGVTRWPTGPYITVRFTSTAECLQALPSITVAQLAEFLALHGLGTHRHASKASMVALLLGHSCRNCPALALTVRLHALRRARPAVRAVIQRRLSPPSVEANSVAPGGNEGPFPQLASRAFKRELIRAWQDHMSADSQSLLSCAVCAQRFKKTDISEVDLRSVDLTLLRNEGLPDYVLPSSYNVAAYGGAILHVKALRDVDSVGFADVCHRCARTLRSAKMPLDAIANYHYYAHAELPPPVADAFARASLFDLMLVARARATRISYLFNHMVDGSQDTRQGYIRGNVAILPQDTYRLRDVIPPGRDEIREALCALFVSSDVVPSKSNVERLRPVLVNKEIVRTLANFLVENNQWYRGQVRVDESNIEDLYDGNSTSAVPRAVEVCCLQSRENTLSCDQRPTHLDCYADLSAENGPVVDAVGYAAGDHSPVNFRLMKAAALAHCLDGKRFIQVQSGSRCVSSEEPGLLAWVFPHLDPFGVGGFLDHAGEGPDEGIKVSFARKVHNLLSQDDSPFARDASFPYVCWNIMQRRELNRSLVFRLPVHERVSLGRTLYDVAPAITDLMRRWLADPWAKPVTDPEKQAVTVLNKLQNVSRHLRGTTGYKQCRRNEIRSLIRTFGTPALFITVNPSDLYNPLVGMKENVQLEAWQNMSLRERASFVASNPAAAASAFDETIRAFVDIILYGKGFGRGLFGKCVAHYGMVEAQGRGTLHVHFLLWLDGNPNPQLLRDRMRGNPDFQKSVFDWLEDHIKCELPGQREAITGRNLQRPPAVDGQLDPRMIEPPCVDDVGEADFDANFQSFVRHLALRCNWHEHTETCWKHLRNGEPRDDAHCRMRIDGSTRQNTCVDVETGSILLRRLHPRINNYNDVVLFLLRCNMDIKFIGSGPAAKALVFYVTDYITKSSLSVHAGLDAIRYALQRNAKTSSTSLDPDAKEKGVFVKSVNALLGKQELSHQQVMSYLVGGGDHYTSHTFVSLSWFALDLFARRLEEPERATSGSIVNGLCTVTVGTGGLETNDSIQDYLLRPEDEGFRTKSIWHYVSCSEKMRVSTEEARLARLADGPSLGRRPNLRGRFIAEHPQRGTHMVRMRSEPYVVVLTGRGIPTRPGDLGTDEHEEWCRAMMLLFKPWRTLQDLKDRTQTWSDAYHNTVLGPDSLQIIRNLDVERECEDARCDERASRRLAAEGLIAPGNDEWNDVNDLHGLEMSLVTDDALMEGSEDSVLSGDMGFTDSSGPSTVISQVIRTLQKARLLGDECETGFSRASNANDVAENNNVHQLDDVLKDLVAVQVAALKSLRKRKRNLACSTSGERSNSAAKRRRIDDSSGGVSISCLASQSGVVAGATMQHSLQQVVESVICGMGLDGNAEQEMAFRILAEHLMTESREQLLLHISGVGGSGKSHLISAVTQLFEKLSRRHQLLLTAPTGCASVLIGGTTIHSVSMLPRKKGTVNQSDLEDIWKDVRYLIIDEISLVSAKLLSDISHRLCLAKSASLQDAQKPFGGINVIFTGDFGQMKPVRDQPMFGYQLVQRLNAHTTETIAGQSALHGAYLWRLIDKVVILVKNHRAASDAAYVNLLNRVRLGIAWTAKAPMSDEQKGSGVNYVVSDYETLSHRKIDHVMKHCSAELPAFRDAPILVARKTIRDAINARKAEMFSRMHSTTLHLYRSKDTYKSNRLPQHIQEHVWRISSSTSEDSLGCMPLCVGMPVMVTENLTLTHAVVNGARGTVHSITFITENGYRYASCVYVHIADCNVNIVDDLPDVVPIAPTTTSFQYKDAEGLTYRISRSQVPLLPAFAFTDYKIQGQTLPRAIVDLEGCRSLQSVYVMLSRAKGLKDLLVLRWFSPAKVYQTLSQEFRDEFARLGQLAVKTACDYRTNHETIVGPAY